MHSQDFVLGYYHVVPLGRGVAPANLGGGGNNSPQQESLMGMPVRLISDQ
jgi:hypothetical protein